MISAYKGHTDVVEFLLSHGADPDQQAHCGATALHYAAECGHVDICAALLSYGATLKRNEYDMTAVTTAAERTREKAVELFYGTPNLLTKEEVKFLPNEFHGSAFTVRRLTNFFTQQCFFFHIFFCSLSSFFRVFLTENRRIRINGSIIC